MSDKIVITAAALTQGENPVLEALRRQGYDPVVHRGARMPTPGELRSYLREAVGMIAGGEAVDASVLEAAPRLRVISRFGVGYDKIDVEAATRRGIVVTYIPGAMVDAVADLTFGLMLAAARRIPELDRSMKAGEWSRQLGVDVARRTLGIVGTGRIGMAVAERSRGFRMRLLGYDPFPNPAFVETFGGDYVPLEELLQLADFVTLHLPLTPETHHLIGKEQLALMKPTAYLINASRGPIVDEAALTAALQEGRIRGAGLDVYEQEPPGSTALVGLPQVVATPHVASFTDGGVTKMAQAALENLMAVLMGERPKDVVNPEVYDRLRPEAP